MMRCTLCDEELFENYEIKNAKYKELICLNCGIDIGTILTYSMSSIIIEEAHLAYRFEKQIWRIFYCVSEDFIINGQLYNKEEMLYDIDFYKFNNKLQIYEHRFSKIFNDKYALNIYNYYEVGARIFKAGINLRIFE
jgi:hypothetical protein